MEVTHHWVPMLIYLVVFAVIILFVVAYVPGALKNIFGIKEEFPQIVFEPYTVGEAAGAKALSVMIGPDETLVIYKFHLTSENIVHANQEYPGSPLPSDFFRIDETNFSRPLCVIFAVDERGDLQYRYVYYVAPLSRIHGDSGSINSHIFIVRKGYKGTLDEECEFCVDERYSGDRGGEGKLLSQSFTNVVDNKCNQNKDYCPGEQCCNLLQGAPSAPKYKVKYGLICDERGLWRRCTGEGVPPINILGIDFHCIWDADKDYGKWEPTGAPSCPDKCECLIAGNCQLLTGGRAVLTKAGWRCEYEAVQQVQCCPPNINCPSGQICSNYRCIEGNCLPRRREAEPDYCAVATQCGTEHCCVEVAGRCVSACERLGKTDCERETYCCRWAG